MSHRITIPNTHPHHQKLTEMINSYSGIGIMLRAFLSYSKTVQKYLIIIHVSHSQAPKDLSQKWIRKALEQYDTYIIIMGTIDVKRHLSLGSLFIHRYCNASTLIYKAEGQDFVSPKLKKQLKKFNRFKEEYFHTHDLLSTEIQRAKNLNSLPMAYHLYISVFEHHLFHMELLCLGNYFYNDTLNERILRLERFLPEIKSLMLKKTETTYFLIEALKSAKEADEEQESTCLKNEFEESIAQTEQQFYCMVEGIFQETQKSIKKIDSNQAVNISENKTVSLYEPVIKILTKFYRIEEIFLFHHEEVCSIDQKTIVLYVLLISNKISNQDLFNMMHIVSQQTGGKFNIIPIAHSKVWIQENLWEYQSFFKKIMVPEKSIYTESPSVIHWHKEDSKKDFDYGIYYRRCSELYEKYKLLRSQENPISHEGLGLILSGFFHRACSIFIYVNLHYRPNEINLRILWKLCAYTDPKLRNLDYFVHQLPFDFFEFLNPSRNLYKNAFLLNEEVLSVLDELTENFFNLLEEQFD